MSLSRQLLRFRHVLLALIIVLGFWAPFERIGGAHPGTTWLFLSGLLARSGVLAISSSSIAVMALAILFAVLAALLRTWRSAVRLETENAVPAPEISLTAQDARGWPHNASYVGTWLHTLALSVLMPPLGALFAVVAVLLLNLWLVRIEPSTGNREADTGRTRAPVPRTGWGRAFLGELYMWGVALTYAALASRYNATLLEQGILISLGISILVKAFLQPQRAAD